MPRPSIATVLSELIRLTRIPPLNNEFIAENVSSEVIQLLFYSWTCGEWVVLALWDQHPYSESPSNRQNRIIRFAFWYLSILTSCDG